MTSYFEREFFADFLTFHCTGKKNKEAEEKAVTRPNTLVITTD